MEKELTLNESIARIRVELQNTKIKKSGKNKFAGFDYFELADFLPTLNVLMQKYGINDVVSIIDNNATLRLIKNDEVNIYSIPFIMFETPMTYKKDKSGNIMKDKEGNYIQIPSMQDIQYLGALNTYYKRYLYLNAFGITDGEIIDGMDNNEIIEIDYKKKVMEYVESNEIDKKEFCVKYKLNAKSTQNDYKKICVEVGIE